MLVLLWFGVFGLSLALFVTQQMFNISFLNGRIARCFLAGEHAVRTREAQPVTNEVHCYHKRGHSDPGRKG